VIDSALWAAAFGYFAGSIPFGLLVARVLVGRDPRTVGSGNIGATNVLRTGGRLAGALTLLLDLGKGALAVGLASNEEARAAAAIGAVVGHSFPIWLGFRGGKGVATMFGVFVPWQPLVALCAFAVWSVSAWRTRYVSLSSMMAAASLAPFSWALAASAHAIAASIAIAAIVIWRHKDNIARLRAGTEPTIGEDRAARERELRK